MLIEKIIAFPELILRLKNVIIVLCRRIATTYINS